MSFRLRFSAQLHPTSVALFSLDLLQSSIFLLVLEYTQFIPGRRHLHLLSLLPSDALPVFNKLHMVESLSFKSHINESLPEFPHHHFPNITLIDALHSSYHSYVLYADPCLLPSSLGNRSLQESIDGLSTLLGKGSFLDF